MKKSNKENEEKLNKDIEDYFEIRKDFDDYMAKCDLFNDETKNQFLTMIVTQNDLICKLLSYIILKMKDGESNEK